MKIITLFIKYSRYSWEIDWIFEITQNLQKNFWRRENSDYIQYIIWWTFNKFIMFLIATKFWIFILKWVNLNDWCGNFKYWISHCVNWKLESDSLKVKINYHKLFKSFALKFIADFWRQMTIPSIHILPLFSQTLLAIWQKFD